MLSLMRSLQRCHWQLLWTTLPRQAQDKDVDRHFEKDLNITSITCKLLLVFREFADTRSSKDVKETALYLTVQLGAALDDPNSGKVQNTLIFETSPFRGLRARNLSYGEAKESKASRRRNVSQLTI